MPRKEGQAQKAARARRMLMTLARARPSPEIELNGQGPLELLVATILSAQCTDQRVNQVTPALFRRYRTAADYAAANQAEVEALIRTTGFYKNKARNIIGCCRALVERFKGQVPDTMEELVTLPGVGRKTANVVLGNWFGQPAVIVDTHVTRVSHRLSLAASDGPDNIEQELQRLLPRDQWTTGSQRLLLHGRYVCLARSPKCDVCLIYAECPWEEKRPR